jgi:Tol biopolymer transport system component/serine/threonine protein kinase
MVGRTVSHYRVLELLGSGGMGTVYQAEDTKLGRRVALKFLPADLSRDRHALDRFQREARAASALNHPHICTIYDIDEAEGQPFIAMELLEGQTLKERLQGRPLPTPEIVDLGLQLADALEAAHAKGIVHRDVKPANIFITTRGTAKLLDFGLAKLAAEPRQGASEAPTATAEWMTGAGVALGTGGYLSPEQVRGAALAGRTDLFSLGVVLYEMATGRRPFAGKTSALIFDAILHETPVPSTRLNPAVPEALQQIIDKALEKDRTLRYQSAADIWVDLQRIQRSSGSAQTVNQTGRSRSRTQWTRSVRPWALFAFSLAVVAAAVAGYHFWPDREDRPAVVALHQVTSGSHLETDPAVSPDGTTIAYVSNESGQEHIWLVDAKGGPPQQWTSGPATDTHPAWYPDGRALTFESDRDGRRAIWKAPRLNGDAAQLLVPDALRPAISPDGRAIAFLRSAPDFYSRVAVAPIGEPDRARFLTGAADGQWNHESPAWSPDGSTICYRASDGLWLVPVARGRPRRLTTSHLDVEPTWSPDGRHVYYSSASDGPYTLWRIDVAGGSPFRVTTGVGSERAPSVSRDGRTLAFSTETGNRHLFLIELATLKETELAASSREETYPVFSPDGRTVYFASNRWGAEEIWRRTISGGGMPTGPPIRLTDQAGKVANLACSPDGKWLVYYKVEGGRRDIWSVPTGGGSPAALTDRRFRSVHPAWSPDGAWLAFVTEEAGPGQISIQRFADGRAAGERRQLTFEPGDKAFPSWSPDGRRIAYSVDIARGRTGIGIVSVDGKERPRIIQTSAEVWRTRWIGTPPVLFVAGFWNGPQVELRVLDPESGKDRPLRPPVLLGTDEMAGVFDVSSDGRFVVVSRGQRLGNIWVLGAESRPF